MRDWTPETRAKQAELIRRHKPWTRSTGPRTNHGKARSGLNGCTSLGLALAAQDEYRRCVLAFQKIRNYKTFGKKRRGELLCALGALGGEVTLELARQRLRPFGDVPGAQADDEIARLRQLRDQ